MDKDVITEIVAQGFCVGCGVCVSLCPNMNLKIIWNKFGEFQPKKTGDCPAKCTICLNVCPRFHKNKNQYELSKDQFSEVPDMSFNNIAGYYIKCFAGYVTDEQLRNQAASGGLCTAFLRMLLDTGKVDSVVCVRPAINSNKLFEFFIASSYEQLYQAASSAYYPIEMSKVIRKILAQPEAHYAIVGLPCFLTAVSLAQKQIPKLRRIIKYKIGLVCGSLPNKKFNEKILAQFKLSEKSTQSIKFRDTNNFPNRLKGIKITDIHGKEHFAFNAHEAKVRRSGRFVYTACMFCSDIYAENADAVFMDSWLPEYLDDHLGTSLVQIRNHELIKIIDKIVEQQLANVSLISIGKIISSQQPRINNKRIGLPYRIELCKKWDIPYPENIHIGMNRQKTEINQKNKIAIKFVEHLRSHNLRVGYKSILPLLPYWLSHIFKESKSNLKEVIRKYYYNYQYLKKK